MLQSLKVIQNFAFAEFASKVKETGRDQIFIKEGGKFIEG